MCLGLPARWPADPRSRGSAASTERSVEGVAPRDRSLGEDVTLHLLHELAGLVPGVEAEPLPDESEMSGAVSDVPAQTQTAP